MLASDLVSTAALPRSALDLLRSVEPAGRAAGLSAAADAAWAFAGGLLVVWRLGDGRGGARTLRPPFAVRGAVHVELLEQPAAAGLLTVLLRTAEGQLAAWLDADAPQPPLTLDLGAGGAGGGAGGGASTAGAAAEAMAAVAIDTGAGPGFVAVVAHGDGLHLVQGSQRGLFLRRFRDPGDRPAPSAGGGGTPGSAVLGALGSVLRAAYSEAFNPLRRYQRGAASQRPALRVALAAVDVHALRALVLTPEALDCWSISIGAFRACVWRGFGALGGRGAACWGG